MALPGGSGRLAAALAPSPTDAGEAGDAGRAGALTEPRWVRWSLIALALGFLGFFLVVPLVLVLAKGLADGAGSYLAAVREPVALAAVRLTLLVAACAVPVNLLFGLAAAWAIAKFRFRGKNLLISLIDLPFAVSPVIAGMMFVLLFGAHGWLGPFLAAHDLKVIFALPGIVLATIFVTSPLIARELIPLMQAQGNEEEEAAVTLGASGWQVFFRVSLPKIKWGLLYGVVLCNARAMGEFGAVSVVSGHIRGLTDTLPLHVEILYNEYQFTASFAVASLLTLLALVTLVLKTLIEGKAAPARSPLAAPGPHRRAARPGRAERQTEAGAILAGIAVGVFSVDRDRRLRYLNPQAAALLGVRAEDVLGRFCGDVLRPRPLPGTAGIRPCDDHCPIVQARYRGTARAVEHLELGGSARTVALTSSAPAGERQFQVMRDETEVEATRRLRDTVLANISHEFKTPLAAQLASVELLRDRLPESAEGAAESLETAETAEIRGLVETLERGTLRLTHLVDNLLESVRIESGVDGIRRRPVELDQVVENAAALMAPLLAQRRQHLEIDLPYPLPAVEGDGPRLTQVFVNLLANANKFAPEGSTIAVRGAVSDSRVALWVEDEGPGLPPGAGESLFERFVRAAGEEPAESGMGLGLWLVHSIVQRHGGSVEAESRRDGPGARLRIVLPLPPPLSPPASTVEGAAGEEREPA